MEIRIIWLWIFFKLFIRMAFLNFRGFFYAHLRPPLAHPFFQKDLSIGVQRSSLMCECPEFNSSLFKGNDEYSFLFCYQEAKVNPFATAIPLNRRHRRTHHYHFECFSFILWIFYMIWCKSLMCITAIYSLSCEFNFNQFVFHSIANHCHPLLTHRNCISSFVSLTKRINLFFHLFPSLTPTLIPAITLKDWV